MLKELVKLRDIETLIPNTGIQSVDLGLKLSVLDELKIRRGFWAEIHEDAAAGQDMFTLHSLVETDEGPRTLAGPGEASREPDDMRHTYTISSMRALEVLADEKIPVPFFRVKNPTSGRPPEFEPGPVDWARVFVTTLPAPDRDGFTHRVTLQFDTRILARRSDGVYAAPDNSDPVEASTFALVDDPVLNRSFVAADWIQVWLQRLYVKFINRTRPGSKPITIESLRDPDANKLGEYWAVYQVLLECLAKACKIPRFTFVDTIEAITLDPTAKVEVDVMIDVGNNRTCGMYVEHFRDQDRVDISAAKRLEIRDLTQPAQVYSEPFQSQVEFNPPSFGFDVLEHGQKRPPRSDSFYWPSPVRVGPEAARLSALSDGTDGPTGMSSPKRFLWDGRARQDSWRNNPGAARAPGMPAPPIRGPITGMLTESGALADDKEQPGSIPRYSRASMYSLMLSEILLHVIVQINSVAARRLSKNPEQPRVLRKLVLTLPSATPVVEQRAMRQLAKNALKLVWRSMRWPADVREAKKAAPQDSLFVMPEIELNWDEASCTQLVYLYNEVQVRFKGTPAELFEFLGRGRRTSTGPAVRIASIDIGGGTTDLMVIQHEVSDKYTITPRQLFREGFKQAGDDVVKIVAEHCVLPALRKALADAGVARADAMLATLFGGDREGVFTPTQARRALFVNQVIVPAALGLLSRYEHVDLRRVPAPEQLVLGDLLPADKPLSATVRGYLEEAAKDAGASGFDVTKTPIAFDANKMTDCVGSILRPMIENLCDVVREYDCDVLLLSGRPSRLPLFRELVLANGPAPLDQIITLHDYEVGHWYPFRSIDNFIADPKTTAVVGAMLCQTCEGGAEGFFMKSSELKMKSTARFIGRMHRDTIAADEVIQSDINPDEKNLLRDRARVTVNKMETAFFLGYRQLPVAHWPATPLMWVQFANGEEIGKRIKPPIKLVFQRAESKSNDEAEQIDTFMESFVLEEATDSSGDPLRTNPAGRPDIITRMQTLRISHEGGTGYWLDTGVLEVEQSRLQD